MPPPPSRARRWRPGEAARGRRAAAAAGGTVGRRAAAGKHRGRRRLRPDRAGDAGRSACRRRSRRHGGAGARRQAGGGRARRPLHHRFRPRRGGERRSGRDRRAGADHVPPVVDRAARLGDLAPADPAQDSRARHRVRAAAPGRACRHRRRARDTDRRGGVAATAALAGDGAHLDAVRFATRLRQRRGGLVPFGPRHRQADRHPGGRPRRRRGRAGRRPSLHLGRQPAADRPRHGAGQRLSPPVADRRAGSATMCGRAIRSGWSARPAVRRGRIFTGACAGGTRGSTRCSRRERCRAADGRRDGGLWLFRYSSLQSRGGDFRLLYSIGGPVHSAFTFVRRRVHRGSTGKRLRSGRPQQRHRGGARKGNQE